MKANWNVVAYADYLVSWLEKQRIENYNANGYTIGISGGIDSAVVACLLAKTGARVQGIALPSANTPAIDIEQSQELAESINCPLLISPITDIYDTFIKSMQPLFNDQAERQNVISGNVQARLRMIALYAHAQSHNHIVVGTDNAAEWHMGYFTKFGDGGADILPLVHLTKAQVYDLARYLNVPQSIINKAPSAGLWVGQTDEDEMGVTYAEIDAYLQGETVSEKALERINFWHNRSHHKRELAAVPEVLPR
ncbi:NAD(+) synthase [Pasteurella atlantica]|uniref:NAD(+) synthase n=1 Tax=Pasteurellaceae TaxID=712 RepID=UPI002743A37A|nr:NAD(+) synthase [Pasteurella atlantica]MDP8033651.1 NAD(+) synthase [Pasteurella atlantica]MDP8035569.1 NAD(+) synthase [Pasteurella atlantica]MDP8037520.1 NAD(+) synthase [Pasteurella atlantica]MDP8047869.1 NAD(+) synthase [Pasteurella atlantica]MDP8049824.1 NAD(+) synthase [Pasteurella atlantica]